MAGEADGGVAGGDGVGEAGAGIAAAGGGACRLEQACRKVRPETRAVGGAAVAAAIAAVLELDQRGDVEGKCGGGTIAGTELPRRTGKGRGIGPCGVQDA